MPVIISGDQNKFDNMSGQLSNLVIEHFTTEIYHKQIIIIILSCIILYILHLLNT
jgi:hypothetical protein